MKHICNVIIAGLVVLALVALFGGPAGPILRTFMEQPDACRLRESGPFQCMSAVLYHLVAAKEFLMYAGVVALFRNAMLAASRRATSASRTRRGT